MLLLAVLVVVVVVVAMMLMMMVMVMAMTLMMMMMITIRATCRVVLTVLDTDGRRSLSFAGKHRRRKLTNSIIDDAANERWINFPFGK